MSDAAGSFGIVAPFSDRSTAIGASLGALLVPVALGLGAAAAVGCGALLFASSPPPAVAPLVARPVLPPTNPFGALRTDVGTFAQIEPPPAAAAAKPVPQASAFSVAVSELEKAANESVAVASQASNAALAALDAASGAGDVETSDIAPPDTDEAVPLPPTRPANSQAQVSPGRRPSSRRLAASTPVLPAPGPAADHRSFFERLFGGRDQQKPQSGAVLAYAQPEDGGIRSVPGFGSSTSSPAGGYDRFTAVYDISAHTVIMPNGERLEAHSGLADRLDDPSRVSEKNRGPTPPHLYTLSEREQLFHGVRALRLNPVGSGSMYGRTGILAHTYMLGPNGDSNGCVSFRDYQKFLNAYLNGEVKRLVVVARSS